MNNFLPYDITEYILKYLNRQHKLLFLLIHPEYKKLYTKYTQLSTKIMLSNRKKMYEGFISKRNF